MELLLSDLQEISKERIQEILLQVKFNLDNKKNEKNKKPFILLEDVPLEFRKAIQRKIEFNFFYGFFRKYFGKLNYYVRFPHFSTEKELELLEYIIHEIFKVAYQNNFTKIIDEMGQIEQFHVERPEMVLENHLIDEKIIKQIPVDVQKEIECNFFYDFFCMYLSQWKNDNNNENQKLFLDYILFEILDVACWNSFFKIVYDLVECNFPIKRKNSNFLLLVSSSNGCHQIVKSLIDIGFNVNRCFSGAFQFAVGNCHTEVIKLLLKTEKFDIHNNYEWSLKICIEYGYIDIFNLLIEYGKLKHYIIDYNDLIEYANTMHGN